MEKKKIILQYEISWLVRIFTLVVDFYAGDIQIICDILGQGGRQSVARAFYFFYFYCFKCLGGKKSCLTARLGFKEYFFS